jgi:hypothetical protein
MQLDRSSSVSPRRIRRTAAWLTAWLLLVAALPLPLAASDTVKSDLESSAPGAAPRLPYISVGIGPTAGLAGVEVTWISTERRTAFSAGAGRAGIGARSILFFEGAPWGREGVRHYVSAGYLLTPWESGNIDATGAVVIEGGQQMLRPDGRFFMDMAVGLTVIQGGSWGGNTAGVVLRLQAGLPLRRPAR